MNSSSNENLIHQDSNQHDHVSWPIFKYSKNATKFWEHDYSKQAKHSYLFEGSFMRIGKLKKKPYPYYYRLTNTGLFKYYKNDREKNWKGLLYCNLSIHISIINLNIEDKQILSLLIQKNQNTYIQLYTQEEQVFSLFGLMKLFCITNGFRDHYITNKLIGSGSFGQVYQVQNIQTEKLYAAKVYTQKQFENYKNKKILQRMLINEIQILRKIKHANILELYEVFQDSDRLIMIFELIEGQELYDITRKYIRLSNELSATIIKDIASALDCLHSQCQISSSLHFINRQGFVHRDIKLENIMVKPDTLQSKLIDFGFAEKINKEKLVSKSGTPGYVCPELFDQKPFTEKGDIYALGIVLFAVVSGYSPFTGKTLQEMIADNRQGLISFNKKIWKTIDNKCKNLITRMVKTDSYYRCTAKEILQSAWIKSHKLQQSEKFIEIEEDQLQLDNIQQQSYEYNSYESNLSQQYQFSKEIKSFYAKSSNKTMHSDYSMISNNSRKSILSQKDIKPKKEIMKRSQTPINKSSKPPLQQRAKSYKFQGKYYHTADNLQINQETLNELDDLSELNKDDLIPIQHIQYLDASYKLFNQRKKPTQKSECLFLLT